MLSFYFFYFLYELLIVSAIISFGYYLLSKFNDFTMILQIKLKFVNSNLIKG